MHKTVKQVLIGAGLVAGLATSAQAQYLTDAGSPLGGGGGASGSVANYSHSARGLNFFASERTVVNPLGGGRLPVNEAARTAFVEVMTLSGTSGSLAATLGGSAQAVAFEAAAGAFARALRASGTLPQAALDLINAFNALVDAPSASVDALATVRSGVMEMLELPGRASTLSRGLLPF